MRTWRLTPITEDEARTILSWRYPDVAALYQPDPENLEEDLSALLNPDYHYMAVHDGADVLVGFCCFGEDAQVTGGDYGLPALDVGLGIRPDLVGKGLSAGYLDALLAWAREHFQPDNFRATVAAQNVRSLRMFARAGFMTVQRFRAQAEPAVEFVVLIRVADGEPFTSSGTESQDNSWEGSRVQGFRTGQLDQ